jgi:hypothetical protein
MILELSDYEKQFRMTIKLREDENTFPDWQRCEQHNLKCDIKVTLLSLGT